MSAPSVERESSGAVERGAGTDSRGIAIGLVAAAPLFAAYELGLELAPGAKRNVGELALGLALRPLGEDAHLARWIAVAIAVAIGAGVSLKRGTPIVARCARIAIEGAIAAAVLGPLLVLSVAAIRRGAPALDVSWDATARPPDVERAALVTGGAAWEELAFRFLLFSLVYWLAARATRAFGGGERAARVAGELAGLALSTGAFVLVHFDPFVRWLGASGRALDPALATWLGLAGAALGILYRWRGFGVAAWTHALFNLGLWIGVDPDVLL